MRFGDTEKEHGVRENEGEREKPSLKAARARSFLVPSPAPFLKSLAKTGTAIFNLTPLSSLSQALLLGSSSPRCRDEVSPSDERSLKR